MKNILFLAAIGCTIASCSVSTPATTEKKPDPILLGVHTTAALRQQPYSNWFTKNYDEYAVDRSTVTAVEPLLKNKTIEIFMGTWCGDSKREVPRMLKLLDQTGFPHDRVKLIMVNNHDSAYKQSPGHEERGINIHRVPTLIVYENNAETGRIVETPVVSLEKDLLAILTKENYPTSYKGIQFLEEQFKEYGISGVESKAFIVKELQALLKNKFELGTYGRINMEQGAIKKAVLIYTLNAQAFPKEADVFYRLGTVHQSLGNKEKARENFEQALLLKPEYPEAKKKLEALGNKPITGL